MFVISPVMQVWNIFSFIWDLCSWSSQSHVRWWSERFWKHLFSLSPPGGNGDILQRWWLSLICCWFANAVVSSVHHKVDQSVEGVCDAAHVPLHVGGVGDQVVGAGLPILVVTGWPTHPYTNIWPVKNVKKIWLWIYKLKTVHLFEKDRYSVYTFF